MTLTGNQLPAFSFVCMVFVTLTTSRSVPLVTVRATVGSRVQLSCTTQRPEPVDWTYVRSSADTQVSYVYAGGKLVNGYRSKYEMENQNEYIYNLVIPSVQKDDSGIFTCTENEGVGATLTRLNLIVSGPQTFQLVPNNTINVVAGGEFSIECLTGIEEPVDFNFLPNFAERDLAHVYADKILLNSFDGRVSVNADIKSGRYQLVVKNVNASMSGTFICIENGGVGPGSDRVKVNVLSGSGRSDDVTTTQAAFSATSDYPTDFGSSSTLVIAVALSVSIFMVLVVTIVTKAIVRLLRQTKAKKNITLFRQESNGSSSDSSEASTLKQNSSLVISQEDNREVTKLPVHLPAPLLSVNTSQSVEDTVDGGGRTCGSQYSRSYSNGSGESTDSCTPLVLKSTET